MSLTDLSPFSIVCLFVCLSLHLLISLSLFLFKFLFFKEQKIYYLYFIWTVLINIPVVNG